MWAYLGSNIQTGLVKPEILTGGEITLRNTKIICTLGPAVDSEEAIRKLVLGGMNTARFNFSHGTHESHLATFRILQRVRDETRAAGGGNARHKGPGNQNRKV